MFFLSREARRLCGRNMELKSLPFSVRIAADQAILKFSESKIELLLLTKTIMEIATLKASLADSPGTQLIDHVDSYQYLTEDFVTRDYTRIDLLKMAVAIAQYELPVIKRLGNKCKQLRHFTLPYLIGALDQEGSEVIEDMRRENRLAETVAKTKPLYLPTIRPTDIPERMAEIEAERKIDNALKGK